MNQEINNSETACKEWLTQIGATYTSFVGYRKYPPDFEATFRGESIAVEVTRMEYNRGWNTERKYAFERQLSELIRQVQNEDKANVRWCSSCVYDPRQERPPKKNDQHWQELVRHALQQKNDGGTYQLIPERQIKGRGVRLRLHRVNGEGAFDGVYIDEGYLVAPTLSKCILAAIERKTEKIQNKPTSCNNHKWWLVLSDELWSPFVGLTGGLPESIIEACETATLNSPWSKVVLLSRHVGPSEQPLPFIPLWEDPAHALLPKLPKSAGQSSA